MNASRVEKNINLEVHAEKYSSICVVFLPKTCQKFFT